MAIFRFAPSAPSQRLESGMPHQPGRHVDIKYLGEVRDRLETLENEMFSSEIRRLLGEHSTDTVTCDCRSEDAAHSDPGDDTYCPRDGEKR